jgi:hypothetical protein
MSAPDENVPTVEEDACAAAFDTAHHGLRIAAIFIILVSPLGKFLRQAIANNSVDRPGHFDGGNHRPDPLAKDQIGLCPSSHL